MQDIAKAQSVTGSGYHQSKIQLMQPISFVEECNAHREIQRSMKILDPQYRTGFNYTFNNAVVHNSWAFPRHLYSPIQGFGWGPRKTTLLWQYHALPKDPNYRHPVNFHASNSTSTLTTTTTSQPRGASTWAQQFPPVQQFPVRANANQQLSHIHVQQSNISTAYVVCAPSMTEVSHNFMPFLMEAPLLVPVWAGRRGHIETIFDMLPRRPRDRKKRKKIKERQVKQRLHNGIKRRARRQKNKGKVP
ncbi:uncharacterized protein LOC124194820 [Daphnia pulex]|uniref:uncharacterized protein LOC124194820 n=1 Tax=Daphnia pulex TaxID=6669 RepID=UPI001EDF8A4C|nr:uncharacterized protein LOC124194820 [Daphnia pulex]